MSEPELKKNMIIGPLDAAPIARSEAHPIPPIDVEALKQTLQSMKESILKGYLALPREVPELPAFESVDDWTDSAAYLLGSAGRNVSIVKPMLYIPTPDPQELADEIMRVIHNFSIRNDQQSEESRK